MDYAGEETEGSEDSEQWPPAPPSYDHSDGGGERPPFVLIDPCAYFADRDNATTAVCEMMGPNLTGRLKVTFCAVAPPLVSYLCVHATHMDYTEFAVAPYIMATETDGGLVLLCVATGDHPNDALLPRNGQYFVYDALTHALHHLPRPSLQHEINESSPRFWLPNTKKIPRGGGKCGYHGYHEMPNEYRSKISNEI